LKENPRSQLQTKIITKDLVTQLKKSSTDIEKLLGKINDLGQEDVQAYLDKFINDLKESSDEYTHKMLKEIFFYTYFSQKSPEKIVRSDACITQLPIILSDINKLISKDKINYAKTLHECLNKYFLIIK